MELKSLRMKCSNSWGCVRHNYAGLLGSLSWECFLICKIYLFVQGKTLAGEGTEEHHLCIIFTSTSESRRTPKGLLLNYSNCELARHLWCTEFGFIWHFLSSGLTIGKHKKLKWIFWKILLGNSCSYLAALKNTEHYTVFFLLNSQ